jgi:hypothetical protein
MNGRKPDEAQSLILQVGVGFEDYNSTTGKIYCYENMPEAKTTEGFSANWRRMCQSVSKSVSQTSLMALN